MADVCRYFGFVVDVSRYSVLMEFGEILGSVESGGFLIVDIDGNLSGFLGFLFRVGTVGHKTFLLAAGGGK